jgi:uncharacterized protein (TIGR03437 family)
MTMPVHAATPAIFSLDASGGGTGRDSEPGYFHQYHRQSRRAALGDRPLLHRRRRHHARQCRWRGDRRSVLRCLTQTPVVTVTIGGVNAAVKYAGAVPGTVAGLTQINVEVPAGLTPAIALPVIVKIGDFTSTGSVTVAVK